MAWRPRHIKPRPVKLDDGRTITVKSGLEKDIALQIQGESLPVRYEELRIDIAVPARKSFYKPDFELPNGIIVEGKGEFDAKDRHKHELVREQHPHLDIRFIFNNPDAKLYKGSPTSYAAWCNARGFKYAKKAIPASWFKEKRSAPHP